MDDLNSVHLTGTLERDPVKHHEETPMLGFTIRVDEVDFTQRRLPMPKTTGFHRPTRNAIRPNDPAYCERTFFHLHVLLILPDGQRVCRACRQTLDRQGKAAGRPA